MKKPKDERLDGMRREHARWSSEHGHWSKDVRIWRAEHDMALGVCASIESLARRFDELLPRHQRDLEIHDEEVRLHTKELAEAAPGSKHPGEKLHQGGLVEHQREEEEHGELRGLHDRILAEIERLKVAFPSPARMVPVELTDEIERVPEI